MTKDEELEEFRQENSALREQEALLSQRILRVAGNATCCGT